MVQKAAQMLAGDGAKEVICTDAEEIEIGTLCELAQSIYFQARCNGKLHSVALREAKSTAYGAWC